MRSSWCELAAGSSCGVAELMHCIKGLTLQPPSHEGQASPTRPLLTRMRSSHALSCPGLVTVCRPFPRSQDHSTINLFLAQLLFMLWHARSMVHQLALRARPLGQKNILWRVYS